MILPLARATWPKEWLELWTERAAIIEFMGNLSRQTAEYRAEIDVRRQAAAAEKREERTA